MSNFRGIVYSAIKDSYNNGYTKSGYKLDVEDSGYGGIELDEVGLDNSSLNTIVNTLSDRTGMPITSETSRDWVTISDIESSLSNFFK